MTAATEHVETRDVETDADVYVAECWRCGGPCWQYKGSIHGWTCSACIERYLDEAQARWAAKSEKAREKVMRNLSNLTHEHNINRSSNTTAPRSAADDRRRDATAGCGPRRVSASIAGRASARAS